MQKVLTAAEMRQIDRLTSEKYGIPSLLLMENAAQAAARVITKKLGGSVKDKSILILCGKGNNGGDGAALARILWQQGADVEVCLFGLVENTTGDARVNFEILQKLTQDDCFELTQADLAFEEITSLEEWLEYDSLNFHCDDPDVIVDALFGTGLERPLDGVYEQVAAFMTAFNEPGGESETLIVSLDVPSGLCSDDQAQIGMCPKAHATVTFTAPKLANVLPPASNFNGELFVENIGSPCELINNSESRIYVAERRDARAWLAKTEFTSDSYKNKRGNALLIAGSRNYAGAAVLCGNAAIRSGVGLVTIATPESSINSISSRVSPEIMVRGIAETEGGAISENAFDEIEKISGKFDVVAVGSGLSETDDSTRKFVLKLIVNRRTPLVIDADGLNLLSPFEIKGEGELPIILTPHQGEFLRLLGTDDKSTMDNRIGAARAFALKHEVILVLKGERVLIAEPGGNIVINPTGNSGLGKAGNGDTMTGIIAGFIGQAVKFNADIFETVVAAAYLSGLAGDIAERKFGKRVMTASDVADCLAEAFVEVLK